MAIPKKKKKSLLKTKTDHEEVKQLAANIRNDFHGLRDMAGDSSFRSWSETKNIEVDSLDSKKMYEMYMKYLEETGQ